MMSKQGVDEFLSLLIGVLIDILRGKRSDSKTHLRLARAIADGVAISSKKWMPERWIIPTDHIHPTHEIERVNVSCEASPLNVMMRIDPFLGCANRSVAIYEILDKALDSLLGPSGNSRKQHSPLNYTRLKEQFTSFATMIGINDDVRKVLLDMCHELECVSGNENCDTRRRSIVDHSVPKLRGPRTTTTSARVDHRAACPGTKMVHALFSQTKQKQQHPVKRKHKCAICLIEGHHAPTCRNMLLEENCGRLNVFLKRL